MKSGEIGRFLSLSAPIILAAFSVEAKAAGGKVEPFLERVKGKIAASSGEFSEYELMREAHRELARETYNRGISTTTYNDLVTITSLAVCK